MGIQCFGSTLYSLKLNRIFISIFLYRRLPKNGEDVHYLVHVDSRVLSHWSVACHLVGALERRHYLHRLRPCFINRHDTLMTHEALQGKL